MKINGAFNQSIVVVTIRQQVGMCQAQILETRGCWLPFFLIPFTKDEVNIK